MKDFLNCELKLGDLVVFQNGDYRHFEFGRIISFAPKSLVVSRDIKECMNSDYNARYGRTFRQMYSQVIKMDNPHVFRDVRDVIDK